MIEIFDYLMSLTGVPDLLEHQGQDGFTPLMLLATQNKPIGFKYLVEKYDADIRCQNNKGDTVAHWFSFYGNMEIIDFISNINPDLIHQTNNDIRLTPLMFAVLNNQLSMVKHLVEQYNVDFNTRAINGHNILHLVEPHTSIELVDYIMGLNGSFIESDDEWGRNPLFAICENGNIHVFERLINKYHANSFALDNGNTNIMHFAACSNNTELITYISTLFQNQQPPATFRLTLPKGYRRLTGEWRDDVKSPLQWAIYESKLNSVKQLIRLKANITTTNISTHNVEPKPSTILQYSYHIACKEDDYSIFNYLLSDECLKDWNSQTKLQFNDETTIKIYGQKDPIQQQLEIKFTNSNTLLLEAASNCDFGTMKLLIERNANVYVIGHDDMNILHTIISKLCFLRLETNKMLL